MVKCFKCQFEFHNFDEFFSHLSVEHFLKKHDKYSCLDCKQEFSISSVFKRHMKNQNHFFTRRSNDSELIFIQENAPSESEMPMAKRPRVENLNTNIESASETQDLNKECLDLVTIAKNISEASLKFALGLHSVCNFTRKDVFYIQNSIESEILAPMIEIFRSIFSQPNFYKNKDFNNQVLKIIESPFENIKTEHTLLKVLNKRNLLEDLKHVTVDNKISEIHKNGLLSLSEISVKGIFVPLKTKFKNFFLIRNNIKVTLLNIRNLLSRPLGELSNFVQGTIFREKVKKFPKGQRIIPFFLYVDDLQVNNPLGSHTESVSAFYISFPNFPYSQKLQNILICGFYKSKDMKEYGNTTCLCHLVEQIYELQRDGIDFDIGDEVINVKFVLGLILGDNLGLNTILDFIKGFNANYFCRFCSEHRNICQSLSQQNDLSLRTHLTYSQNVSENNASDTGICRESVLNSIELFHVVDNFAADFMHDGFEGVHIYGICQILLSFINQKYFTLDELNRRKESFNYGETESGNKSSSITINKLQQNNLRMSAKETWTFVHILPFMICDLVPKTSKEWNFLCNLLKLTDLVLLPLFSKEKIIQLKEVIKVHNESYVNVFGQTLKPKHHFLIHYPTIIEKSGPLRHLQTFRFESKHREFKVYANSTSSRKNILLSLVIKNQYKYAYNLLISKDQKDLETMEPCKNNAIFKAIIYSEINYLEAQYQIYNCLRFKGTFYKKGFNLITTIDNVIELFEILQLVVISETEEVFVVGKNQYYSRYEKSLEAYTLHRTKQSLKVLPLTIFAGPPIHIYDTKDGIKAIRPKIYF